MIDQSGSQKHIQFGIMCNCDTPSRPPASFTMMLLSMNLARFTAVSFCLDIVLLIEFKKNVF